MLEEVILACLLMQTQAQLEAEDPKTYLPCDLEHTTLQAPNRSFSPAYHRHQLKASRDLHWYHDNEYDINSYRLEYFRDSLGWLRNETKTEGPETMHYRKVIQDHLLDMIWHKVRRRLAATQVAYHKSILKQRHEKEMYRLDGKVPNITKAKDL